MLNPVELNTNPGHSFILNPIANNFNGPSTKTVNTVFLSQVTIEFMASSGCVGLI